MIGVIADDLTGAAELGAVGLHHGLRTEILVPAQEPGLVTEDPPRPDPVPPALSDRELDLVCIDTHSRSCAPGEAARRAANAARLLRQSGVRWIYKKVDSVLRGEVTAEVEAVMKELAVKRAVLVPANPSLGRTIRRGRYYIHGKPIHKTEFARDPEYPRTSSDLLKLLSASVLFPLCLCGAMDTIPDRGIVVGAAANEEDLKHWATRRGAKTLVAGGAEFFGALLTRAGHSKVEPAPDMGLGPAAGGRELFVCGTLSDSARNFVRAARAAGTPVFTLPKELVWGAGFSRAAAEAIGQKVVTALRQHPRVMLTVGLRVVHERTIARWLVTHLAQVAGTVLRQARVSHVYAEGGATAAELAQSLGWTRLRVLRELAPGVATLAVGDGDALCLTIKPGSYAWPESVRGPGQALMTVSGAQPAPVALSLRKNPGPVGPALGSACGAP
jgi:D-threonate/D-erythronate kinase